MPEPEPVPLVQPAAEPTADPGPAPASDEPKSPPVKKHNPVVRAFQKVIHAARNAASPAEKHPVVKTVK
jgi:hypothetical protein